MRTGWIGVGLNGAVRLSCGLALVAALSGCTSPNGVNREPGRHAASARGVAPIHPIVVGVEYVLLTDPARAARVARMLAPIGAPAAKPHCEQVGWGEMQPAPAAEIDFRRLDGFVRGFQAAGFRELLICLGTHSAWGSRGASAGLRAKSPVPRPERMNDFARWVTAVVERYDADGREDMPGLRSPVRLYEIGSAFSGFGVDFADEYLVMLERAHRAAHAAWSDVMIAHAALLTTGALRDVRDAGNYETAFASLSERVSTQGLRNLRRLLDRPDLFDALNVHALGDPAEVDATLAWLRWETDHRGYFKPVIVSESAPTPLVAWGAATRCAGSPHDLGLVLSPADEDDRCRLAGFFRSLVNGQAEAVAWAQSFAASDLVKKVIVAADRGAWIVNAAPIEDVEWWKRPAFEASAGVSPWGGFLDVRRQERRPVYHALRQLMKGLRGRDRVRRVSLGRSDVRLYAFDGPAGAGWVGWHEPGAVMLPGDSTPKSVISFRVDSKRVRIEPIITRSGQVKPESRLLAARGGVVQLELTPTPVLVYPET